MNRKGKKFDWDNDNFADLQAVDGQPKVILIHPTILSEMPWVKTEDMYDKIIRPTSISKQENPQSYAKRAAKAHKNVGLDTIAQERGANRKQDEAIVLDDSTDDGQGNLV